MVVSIRFFFALKHNRPPGTKPSSDLICKTMTLFPLPDIFGGPVVSPWRNESRDDIIDLSTHVLLEQSPAVTHVSSR